MNNLAKRFIELMDTLDCFTVREYFVSLGSPGNGCDLIMTFVDGSQTSLTWIRDKWGDHINDSLLYREAPDRLWKESE